MYARASRNYVKKSEEKKAKSKARKNSRQIAGNKPKSYVKKRSK